MIHSIPDANGKAVRTISDLLRRLVFERCTKNESVFLVEPVCFVQPDFIIVEVADARFVAVGHEINVAHDVRVVSFQQRKGFCFVEQSQQLGGR